MDIGLGSGESGGMTGILEQSIESEFWLSHSNIIRYHGNVKTIVQIG